VPSVEAPPAGLAELQRFLAGALRREEPIATDPALAGATRVYVAGNDRLTPAEQADLYREQFWLRHVESLTEDYPGLRALLGSDVFDALLHAYLVAYPPRTPSLRDLGADLVRFAERWEGFAAGHGAEPGSAGRSPIVSPARRSIALEMIRYEQAFIDLFDGPEPPPLDAGKLQSLPADAWERARIVLHPLLARLRLEHPLHLYRLAAAEADEAPPFPAAAPVSLVLYRRDNVVRYDEVEPEALALLDALAAGETLVGACDRVAATLDPAAADALGGKVGSWFQRWTANRWIVDIAI
jgi:hypothetical protein